MKINTNYNDLNNDYFFFNISKKVKEFKNRNKDIKVINLGIGDVSKPIFKNVVNAMKKACDEVGEKETFKGYGDEQGDIDLRDKIKSYYKLKNINLTTDEIFISDGAASDIANILDIFDNNLNVIIPNPTYPAYLDANIMNGNNIIYSYGNEKNKFLPLPDNNVKPDVIYLCSPNNPTGSTYNSKQLKIWIDYAIKNNAIIIYDSAYEFFVTGEDTPSSIYMIKGSEKCAIEICSLSKTAGFTGLRCGYTIVPNKINNGIINKMWLRRQCTKYNGTSYITQQGAKSVFTEEGLINAKENIKYYLRNANVIKQTFKELNIWNVGGEYSPYIWFKYKENMSSWEYFDYLLKNINVVGTPGIGFGSAGEGYFRLSSFGDYKDIQEAMERFKKLYKDKVQK